MRETRSLFSGLTVAVLVFVAVVALLNVGGVS